MRAARIASIVSLCAGIALGAAPAGAGSGNTRLQGAFQTTDSVDTENFSLLEADGQLFDAQGIATTVNPDNNDLVEISLFTPMPTNISVNDKKARVQQKTWGQLYFFVDSDDPSHDTDTVVIVEKCDVNVSVNMSKGTGSTTVKCSDPNFWADFTEAQIDAIQSAFANDKRVKVKVNSDLLKGSVSITIKGDAFSAP